MTVEFISSLPQIITFPDGTEITVEFPAPLAIDIEFDAIIFETVGGDLPPTVAEGFFLSTNSGLNAFWTNIMDGGSI